jgi:hypothetical protein
MEEICVVNQPSVLVGTAPARPGEGPSVDAMGANGLPANREIGTRSKPAGSRISPAGAFASGLRSSDLPLTSAALADRRDVMSTDQTELLTVRDLVARVPEGGQQTFARRRAPSGDEPGYYRVATSGTFQQRPRWLNAPELGAGPRSARKDRPARPLSGFGDFEFAIDASPSDVSDFYHVAPDTFLVSERILEIVANDDADLQSKAVVFKDVGGHQLQGFHVAMPGRVIDAVDVEKTTVAVSKLLSAGRFVTRVKYEGGYVLRPDAVGAVASLVEEYRGAWLWRSDLFETVARSGARGFYGDFTSSIAKRPDIRP